MYWMAGKGCVFAYGREHGYLVITGVREVRLTRFSIAAGAVGLTAVTAREAAESTVAFPLGRGPGRPGGEPELAALAEAVKGYAERFEAGESLEGYPAWQHQAAQVPGLVVVTSDSQRESDRAAVTRVHEFFGHIEDMPEEEKLFLIGYLASAVERLLGDDPNAGRCPGPGGCFPGEPCDYADVCSGHS